MARKSSLYKRLNMLLLLCVIPFTVMMVYLLSLTYRFSQRYDVIVKNITSANEYNVNFKEELDYAMYVIVVNSERASQIVDTDPHRLIGEAREVFSSLSDSADNEQDRTELTRIVKSLDTLEERVREIEEDARVVGMYDLNMERLDLNIRVLTELIEEQIQEYIYHEAEKLEDLRMGVRSDVAVSLRISVLVCAAVWIGSFLLCRLSISRLKEGIQQLRMVTRKAGHGDFKVRASIENTDEELAELGEGFNQMVERIGNLVEDIRVEQLNLRLMEQKLLQAQINPHFLYNTLDNIIWLAESGQKEQVVMMVSALSDFFRTTLSRGKDDITVKEEESHIRSYLKIQQFRYQDILEYRIDIPEELYPYHILKLTLQPLVENALYHGIKNKRGKGTITVTGEMEPGRLVFIVKDNGLGMEPDRLAEVRSVMNNGGLSPGDSPGFGLYNVVQRIKLNYGPEYGIWISSTYGEGTEVRVEIPRIP